MKDWGRGQDETKNTFLPIPAPSSTVLHYIINPCRLLSATVWTPPVILISHLTWQRVTLPHHSLKSASKSRNKTKNPGFLVQRVLRTGVFGRVNAGMGVAVLPSLVSRQVTQISRAWMCRHMLPSHLPMSLPETTATTLSCFPKGLVWLHMCLTAWGRRRCQQFLCCPWER